MDQSAPSARYEAFVIQEQVRPDLSQRQQKEVELPAPVTAWIPKVELLRLYTTSHIFGHDKNRVPKELVKEWGLRNGDKVSALMRLGIPPLIVAVNGLTDADKVRARPSIVGEGSIQPEYPFRRLPVEKYKDPTLRAYTLRAPIGKGSRLFIVAPPWAGKTWVARSLFKATLQLTLEDDKLFVIALHVGERAEDGTVFFDLLQETPVRKGRAEVYTTPDGDPEEAHYYMAEYLTDRARRLTESGYDVVLIIDSASRVLLSHSRSSQIPKASGEGMISGGIHESSITATKRILSVAGDFSKDGRAGSLTLAATMLCRDKSGNQRSSEPILYEDTGSSTSSSIWGLVDIGKLPKPWIDIPLTRTREYQRISTPAQLVEMQKVNTLMWDEVHERGGGRRPATVEDALKRLLAHAGKPPIEG